MRDPHEASMRTVFFWTFWVLFVSVSILTILALFFGVGDLDERYEGWLVGAFLVELAVFVFALGRSLFGLARLEGASPDQIDGDPAVVEDSPLGTPISLETEAESEDQLALVLTRTLGDLVAKPEFWRAYGVEYCVFTEQEPTTSFRSNLVVTIDDLGSMDPPVTSLAEHVDRVFAELQQSESPRVVSNRQTRPGLQTIVQWYTLEVPTDEEPVRVQQVQKFTAVGNLVTLIQVSYWEETDPEHVRVLQEVLR